LPSTETSYVDPAAGNVATATLTNVGSWTRSIDWKDGTINDATTHTYITPGTYTPTATFTLNGVTLNQSPSSITVRVC
jgi:hypothetical protein